MKRNLVIGLLVTLALVVSGFTYAFWASSIVDDDTDATGTITIGEGEEVTTTVNVSNVTSAGPLVPVGFTGTNDVDLEFSITWTSDNPAAADALTGVLTATVGTILINGVDFSHLFTVSIVSGNGAITEDIAKTVTVNVEFTNEPADAAEYADVATEDLVVTINFAVVAD